MDKKIARMFDYQKYEQNKDLAAIISDVESRYSLGATELSDDDLSLVAAAGILNNGDRRSGKLPN